VLRWMALWGQMWGDGGNANDYNQTHHLGKDGVECSIHFGGTIFLTFSAIRRFNTLRTAAEHCRGCGEKRGEVRHHLFSAAGCPRYRRRWLDELRRGHAQEPRWRADQVKGIDTPEIKGACAYERRLAAAAREFAAGQLRRAERVTLVRHGRDKYGRTLAYVLVDGKDLGDEMVRKGLARKWEGRRRSWCQ
jgi:micrococcal nuclease